MRTRALTIGAITAVLSFGGVAAAAVVGGDSTSDDTPTTTVPGDDTTTTTASDGTTSTVVEETTTTVDDAATTTTTATTEPDLTTTTVEQTTTTTAAPLPEAPGGNPDHPENHGREVSETARETPPGPDHGPAVCEVASEGRCGANRPDRSDPGSDEAPTAERENPSSTAPGRPAGAGGKGNGNGR